jgi:DNA ligase (NAD+)
MDGVVLKVNSLRHWARLGLKTRHPAYAIAYKPKEWLDQATTVLRAVTVQVGRTGALTPVAELEPVFLDGSTVARATLHNFEELARKDLRIGDTVVIEKAGKVIPAVVRAVAEKRTGAETPVPAPERCPACGGPVGRREVASRGGGEVVLRCENLQCPAQKTRRVEHAAQRAALDLEGLGGVVADRLVECGWIGDFLDLFRLSADRLATLNLGTPEAPRLFGLPNARRVAAAVERARALPLHRWLYALALPEIGEVTAYHLGQRHEDLEAVRDSALLRDLAARDAAQARAEAVNPRSRKARTADGPERERREAEWRGLREEIARLDERLKDLPPGVLGPAAARALLAYFDSEPGRATLRRMQELGLRPRRASGGGGTSELAGKTVVLTGSVEGLTRDQATALLRAAGATVTGSVSGKTDLVIAGAEPGESKMAQARELNLRIVRPEEIPELRAPRRPDPPPGDLFG